MDWKREIEDILAESTPEPQQNLQQPLDQIMLMMMNMLVLTVGCAGIHSTEVRDALRKFCAEQGVSPDKVEQLLYWMIENSTRPLWEEERCQNKP